MITAIDTSVLLDIFGADPTFARGSSDAVAQSLGSGRLLACDIVWAEIAAAFPSAKAAHEAMAGLEVTFSPLDAKASLSAGEAWRAYRAGGGKRTRVIADFLIGAHALLHGDRLLTRDRGFYRTYFTKLVVLDPS